MNMRTKRLGIGGVVAGGLMLGAAALVVGAGIAHADSPATQYLLALERHGVDVDPAYLTVDDGYQACNLMRDGLSGPQLTDDLMRTTTAPYNTIEWVMIDASVYVCPSVPFDGPSGQGAPQMPSQNIAYLERGGHGGNHGPGRQS